MRVYISGKISGISPVEAKTKFEHAETFLKERGYEVVNPMKNGLSSSAPWKKHMIIDITLLFGCEAIYMLPCWEQSKGAQIERFIAEKTGMQFINL